MALGVTALVVNGATALDVAGPFAPAERVGNAEPTDSQPSTTTTPATSTPSSSTTTTSSTAPASTTSTSSPGTSTTTTTSGSSTTVPGTTTTTTSGSGGTTTVPATTTTTSTTTTSTTTTVPATTTTTSTTTTTTTVPSTGGARAGDPDLFVVAKAELDPYTSPTDPATWANLRSTYDAMMVFAPYFDDREALFDDHYVYVNLYGLSTQSFTGSLDWVLRTESGDPVYIPFDCGGASGCTQYAADVANPQYQAYFLAQIESLRNRGYDGIMIDDVNMARRFSDSAGNSVFPVNAATGEAMTLGEWRQDVAALLETVRADFGDLEIAHNAIWFADTPDLASPFVDDQIEASDLIILERGATDPGLTGGDWHHSYAKFLTQIDRIHSLGSNVALIDRTATTEAEQRFNLATVLLINNGGDFVGTENLDFIAPDAVWDEFDVDLGNATGPYQRDGGVWRRDFDGGVVIVVEPQQPTQTVALGGAYVEFGSSTVVTEVTLSGRSAAILLDA